MKGKKMQSAAASTVGGSSLAQLADLTRTLLDRYADVEAAEVALKQATENARVLCEETIPCAMQELGLTEIKLETGEKLAIKQDVYASIPVAFRERAFNWLVEHGFGGLIKVEVNTHFGKGDMKNATSLYNELFKKGLEPELNQNVAPQTLKAFLREQIAAGANVPMDIFGARPVWTTKITKK